MRLVVTVGDPSGIGPEVAVKALAGWPDRHRVVLVGEAAGLREAIERYAPELDVEILALEGLERAPLGSVTAAGGRAAIATLDAGLELVLSGKADVVVTGPIHKGAVRLAGLTDFQGHTEYLAERANVTEGVTMLLESDRLCVVHVSTHRSLRAATDLVPARLDRVIDLAAAYLRDLPGIEPLVLVAGLNPHAGEHGAFGDEEETVIGPAIERARHAGIDFAGPIAPDTVFLNALDRPGTVVVAMYHDQGRIPVKLIARDTAVNVTLGLPFVRTSVDHGTAHDIAGLGRAESTSMRAALDVAARLAAIRCGRSG